MRRHALKLALCLLAIVFVAPPPPKPHAPPPVTPRPSVLDRTVRWSVLEQAIVDQGRWYASAASTPAVVAAPPRPRQVTAVYGTGACGGSLPPCSVMWCESLGNLTAQNPRSTASGKWEILDSTWAGFGGYVHAKDAPEEVQDERARQIYAGGAGRSQWVC